MDDPLASRLIVTGCLITALVKAIRLRLLRQPDLPESASLSGIVHYPVGSAVGMATCLIGLTIVLGIRHSGMNLR